MQKTTTYFLFHFVTAMLKIMGRCNTPLEKYFQGLFPKVYYKAPKSLKFQLVKPKNNCNRLAIAEQDGQKNCNRKTTTALFRNVFFECIEGKSGI
jgi:hypothetical protein